VEAAGEQVKLNLFAVSVASPLDALIVGEQGRVMQTRDGGETWDALASATSVPLFAVSYRGGSAAWVAGRGGAILRRTASVATVNIPRPKLPPALRGKKPPPTQTMACQRSTNATFRAPCPRTRNARPRVETGRRAAEVELKGASRRWRKHVRFCDTLGRRETAGSDRKKR
jgi:hypothetical protein